MKTVTIKLSLAENVQVIRQHHQSVSVRCPICAQAAMWLMRNPFWESSAWIFQKPITMEIYAESCDDLLADIKPFVA